MQNTVILGTGVYIPSNKVYNEEIDEHFEKKGLRAHGLMEHLGRRKRFFISDGETPITMCINAIDNCVKKNKINLEEIEMLIVCTDTPEYLSPTNAVKIAGEYGDKMKGIRIAFDINSNCTSMVMGMDIAKSYMISNTIRKCLVVGCFCVTPSALWDDTVVYANFADASACMALEIVDEQEKRGIISSEVYTDASYHHYVTYPKCGMSKIALKSVEPNQKRLEWIPFDMDFLSGKWNDIIHKLLDVNCLSANDIDYFVFSQLSDVYNVETLKLLDISPDSGKYHFVGKEYGYTGNTCPILCLNRMWDTYNVKGNKIVICTVGAGYSAIAMLYIF